MSVHFDLRDDMLCYGLAVMFNRRPQSTLLLFFFGFARRVRDTLTL